MQEQTGSIAEGPAEETAGSRKTADHFTKQVADNKPAKASNRKGKKENEGGKRKMKVAAFSAKCPYEIGDKIQVIKEIHTGGRKQYMTEPATITDIACTHYLKSGEVHFTYELDGSGAYIPFVTAQEAGLTR